MPSNDSLLKAVVHFNDGSLVKGYVAKAKDNLTREDSPNRQMELTLVSGERRTVDLDTAKAVFFVKSFEGNSDHHEIKFFQTDPKFGGLWVRVRFSDGETLEGTVENSLAFLVNQGFFLKPPDPQSNNQLIFAVKKSFASFHVLGIRPES